MTETLQPILALLDEGLSLYRRNFVGFVLITASWFVPVAICAGLIAVAASWLDDVWPVLLTFAALLLLFPLLIYLIGGLSRAAVAAAEGRAVRFREAMAIHPLRAASMGCFTIVYTIIAQFTTSLLSIMCICPLYLIGLLFFGLTITATNGVGTVAGGMILVVTFLLGVFGSLMISGASGSVLFYGLQPWVQEARPFGESVGRSLELIAYRIGRNLLVWCMAGLLVAAAGTTVTATIGTLLPLPLLYVLGEESPVAQAIAVSAWLIGFMVILPPLPIWMALLYQRNRAAHEGADLQAKVQEWQATGVRSQEPGVRINLLTPDS
jgi:hypothetical protein